MHKFHVGQLVQFNPSRNERFTAPAGPYQVIKKLPHNGQEYEYRVKSAREEHERMARESQLSTGDTSSVAAAESASANSEPPSRRPASKAKAGASKARSKAGRGRANEGAKREDKAT